MPETWVGSLGWEDPLEEGTATPSSVLAWRIPMEEEPGGLQFMGSQRVGHHQATKHSTCPMLSIFPFCPPSRLTHCRSAQEVPPTRQFLHWTGWE